MPPLKEPFGTVHETAQTPLSGLVIESPIESGALISAREAADQGRDVFATSEPIDTGRNAGCHKQNQEGAKLGRRLQVVSIVWSIIECVATVFAGIQAGSLLLVAFGADSGIELISAAVVYRRLTIEATSNGNDDISALDRRTSRIAGYLLLTLAVFVSVAAVYRLFRPQSVETSAFGIAVTIAAAVGMPMLARRKMSVAEAIGSRALRADAIESLTCGYLSWLVLAGLAATAIFHVSWLDAAGCLVCVPFLIKEGREAISGKCICH